MDKYNTMNNKMKKILSKIILLVKFLFYYIFAINQVQLVSRNSYQAHHRQHWKSLWNMISETFLLYF